MMWLIEKPNYTRETPRGLTCMNPSVLDSKAVLDCTQTLGDNTYDTKKFVGPDKFSLHNNKLRGVPVSFIVVQDKRENLSSDKPIRKLSKKKN